MNAEEYLIENQELIEKECNAIAESGSKAIITLKKSEANYIHKISTVEEFGSRIPDNQFFKKMRDGINNAVLNKVIPIVVFEDQKAQIIDLPDCFKSGQ